MQLFPIKEKLKKSSVMLTVSYLNFYKKKKEEEKAHCNY